jgi:hypothetical protein
MEMSWMLMARSAEPCGRVALGVSAVLGRDVQATCKVGRDAQGTEMMNMLSELSRLQKRREILVDKACEGAKMIESMLDGAGGGERRGGLAFGNRRLARSRAGDGDNSVVPLLRGRLTASLGETYNPGLTYPLLLLMRS